MGTCRPAIECKEEPAYMQEWTESYLRLRDLGPSITTCSTSPVVRYKPSARLSSTSAQSYNTMFLSKCSLNEPADHKWSFESVRSLNARTSFTSSVKLNKTASHKVRQQQSRPNIAGACALSLYYNLCLIDERKFNVICGSHCTIKRPYIPAQRFNSLRSSLDNLRKAYNKACVHQTMKVPAVKWNPPNRGQSRNGSKIKPMDALKTDIDCYGDKGEIDPAVRSLWLRLRLLGPDDQTGLRFRMRRDAPMLVAMMAISRRFNLSGPSAMQLTVMDRNLQNRETHIKPRDTILDLGLKQDDLLVFKPKSRTTSEEFSL